MAKYSQGVFLNILNSNLGDWQKQIDFIASLARVEHLEIFLEYLPNEKELQFLKQALASYQKLIHAPFVNLSLISQWKEVRQAYLKIMNKTLELSLGLEAKVITCHVGSRPFFLNQAYAEKIILEEFSPLIKEFGGKINLAFENMPASTGIRAGYPLLDELESLGRKLKVPFTLDVGHALRNGEDWEKFLRRHLSQIVNIHLHDARRDEDHLRLGAGSLDTDKFLNVLAKIHYTNYLTLEVLEKKDATPSRDIATSWEILTAAR